VNGKAVKKNFDNHEALDNGPRLSQNPHVGAEVRPKRASRDAGFFRSRMVFAV